MAVSRTLGQEGERAFSDDRIRCGAAAAISQTIRAGVDVYERDRDLPRLARILPGGMTNSAEAAEAIVARLERALRAERNRARSGHWTYDLNRHIALRQAYVAERERLESLI